MALGFALQDTQRDGTWQCSYSAVVVMVENAKAIIKLLRHRNCHALRKKPTPNPLNLSSDLHDFAFMSAHQMLKQVVASLQFTDIHSIYQLLSTMIVGSITPAPAGSFSQSKQQQRLQCCLRQRILCTALSRGTVGKCRQDSGPIH